jgi:hypothetical protein
MKRTKRKMETEKGTERNQKREKTNQTRGRAQRGGGSEGDDGDFRTELHEARERLRDVLATHDIDIDTMNNEDLLELFSMLDIPSKDTETRTDQGPTFWRTLGQIRDLLSLFVSYVK